MRRTLLHCCLLLLIGQINAFGLEHPRTEAVDPQILLLSSLSIKAEVYFGDEDEVSRPIHNTDFYLLDRSLAGILKDSGFTPETEDGKEQRLEASDYLDAAASAFYSSADESALLAMPIRREIARHQLFAVKTNDSG
jgi:hypothetical protein